MIVLAVGIVVGQAAYYSGRIWITLTPSCG